MNTPHSFLITSSLSCLELRDFTREERNSIFFQFTFGRTPGEGNFFDGGAGVWGRDETFRNLS